MSNYSTIVVGLGAMGSAALFQLAKRSNRCLGLDQFSPPHTSGSTHGETRITRTAIGEGVVYVPLAQRSHQIWREIEAATGRTLFTQNGGVIIGSPAKKTLYHGASFFENTLKSANEHNIPYQLLSAAELRERFPQFKVRGDEQGFIDQTAGYLNPEACVATQLELARYHGAAVHTGETVLHFEPVANGVAVTTTAGSYSAEKLVLTAGPWLPDLLPASYAGIFTVCRQVLFWFEITGNPAWFKPANMPVFIWLLGEGPGIYGFPAVAGLAGGVKIATEYKNVTTPHTVSTNVTDGEKQEMYTRCISNFLNGIGPRCLRAATCLYTNTPDRSFVIDTHPDCAGIIIVSPCSGHGFKHSAAIGEAVAQLATDGRSQIALDKFRLNRFKDSQQVAGEMRR